MLIAITTGLIAGVTSCLLPIYPVLLNILSRNSKHRRLSTIVFASGIALAYIIFYSILAFLITLYGWGFAENIDEKRSILFLVAAIASFYFAIDTLFHLNLFKRTALIFNKVDYSGKNGTFLSGLGYGSIITPCSAPFLIIGILPILASSVTYPQGLVLMVLFSLSLAFPLLVAGLSSAYALDRIRWLQKNTRKIELLSVLFLIVVGVYFLRLYFVI